MNVQEQRSVAQRIAELRRLHELSLLPSNTEDGSMFVRIMTARVKVATEAKALLPVLLAAWELANLEERLHRVMDVLPEGGVRYKHPLYKEYNQLHKDLEMAYQAYREALKGVEDA